MSVPHAPPDQGPAGGAPGGAGSSSLLQPAGDEGYASEDASDGGFGDSDSEFDSEVVHQFTGFDEDDEDDDIGEAAELTEDNDEQPADGNLTAAQIQLGPQGAGGSARAAAALASAMLGGSNPKPAGSKKKKAPAEPERVWGGLGEQKPTNHFPFAGTTGINYPSQRNRSAAQRRKLGMDQQSPLWWFELFFTTDVISRIVNCTNNYVAKISSKARPPSLPQRYSWPTNGLKSGIQ